MGVAAVPSATFVPATQLGLGSGRYVRLSGPGQAQAKLMGSPYAILTSGKAFAVEARTEGVFAAPAGSVPWHFGDWRIQRYFRPRDVVGLDADRGNTFVYAKRDAMFAPMHRPIGNSDWAWTVTRWREALDARSGDAETRIKTALRIYADTDRKETRPDGVVVAVTLQEIAAFTDLCREIIGRRLAALQDQGWLVREGQTSRLTLAWSFLYGDD